MKLVSYDSAAWHALGDGGSVVQFTIVRGEELRIMLQEFDNLQVHPCAGA